MDSLFLKCFNAHAGSACLVGILVWSSLFKASLDILEVFPYGDRIWRIGTGVDIYTTTHFASHIEGS